MAGASRGNEGKIHLGFTYGLSKFITTVEAGPPSRRDDLYTYQVGVSLPVVRRALA